MQSHYEEDRERWRFERLARVGACVALVFSVLGFLLNPFAGFVLAGLAAIVILLARISDRLRSLGGTMQSPSDSAGARKVGNGGEDVLR